MNTNRKRTAKKPLFANLDSVQMSAADREAAMRHLRAADMIATTLANVIARVNGFFGRREAASRAS